jgi:hypothetical protein
VAKLVLLSLFLFAVGIVAYAQEPNPNFNQELDQETPAQAKVEAQKPDSKASAGDLAKAVQNPVASLISVPIQNSSNFGIGPNDRTWDCACHLAARPRNGKFGSIRH